MKKYILFFLFIVSCNNSNQKDYDLKIYSTYVNSILGMPYDIIKLYEEETGLRISLEVFNNRDIIKKIGSQPYPSDVDILWGHHFADNLNIFDNHNTETSNIIDNYLIDNNIFLPFTSYPVVIFINKEELKKAYGDDVKITGYRSIIDLAKSDNKSIVGRIGTMDPSETNIGFRILINQVIDFAHINSNKLMDEALTTNDLNGAWKDVQNLVKTYNSKHYTSIRDMMNDVKSGKNILSITTNTLALDFIDNNIEIVLPIETNNCLVDTISIVKNSANKKKAYDFLNFLISDKVQEKLKNYGRYPIVKTIDDNNLIKNKKENDNLLYTKDEVLANYNRYFKN